VGCFFGDKLISLKRRGAETQRKIEEQTPRPSHLGTHYAQPRVAVLRRLSQLDPDAPTGCRCYLADYDFAGGGGESTADYFLDYLAEMIGSGRSLESGFGIDAVVRELGEGGVF
jgi:hypothetical protein